MNISEKAPTLPIQDQQKQQLYTIGTSSSETISSRPEDSNQNIVTSRSPLDLWVQILGFVAAIAAMVLISYHFPSTVHHVTFDFLKYQISFGIPFFGIIPLVILGRIVHALYDEKYILTPEYLLEVRGILSPSSRTTRLRYHHIRDVELNRKFHQRFFDLGDLVFATSITTGDSNVYMRGILHPDQIKDLVQERMKTVVRTSVLEEASEEIEEIPRGTLKIHPSHE